MHHSVALSPEAMISSTATLTQERTAHSESILYTRVRVISLTVIVRQSLAVSRKSVRISGVNA